MVCCLRCHEQVLSGRETNRKADFPSCYLEGMSEVRYIFSLLCREGVEMTEFFGISGDNKYCQVRKMFLWKAFLSCLACVTA